nr:extracellular solute-binding protein [Rathayibacter sp. VKM Ac-2835]
MIVGLTTITALALSGCAVGGGQSTSAELSEEPVTISLNWWGADARTQATNEAVALFEEEYPNVTVETSFADWTGYWDRLATSTAASDMPDVMQFDQLYLASYADRGTLLDLSTVTNQLDTSELPESILQTGQVGGKQYGLPVGGTPNGVIVNTAILDEYGIAIPDFDTWTWEDYEAIGKEISEKSGGAVRGVSTVGADSFSLSVWARQHGENLYNEDGDVAISPETIVSAWEKSLELIDSGAAPTVEHISETTGASLDQTDLALSKIAFAFIPAGQITAYQAAAPDAKFILGNWPTEADTEPGFQYLKPTQYWVASSKSEHPAEAAALMNFLTSDPDVAKLFGTDRGVPANPTAQEAIESSLDETGKITLDFTNAMAETVESAPPITPNGASDVENVILRYYQQVLFGQLDAEAAAEQLIAEVQTSIDAAN